MPETSTPTLTPDGTTKFPAFQNNNPGNVEVDALKAYILSQAGLANGLATLDAEGKLDSSQIPVNLDDVLVYPSYASLPATGETGKLYITSDVNGTYYWNGTSYQILNQSFVRYRGSLSSLPSDPQPGDWFIAASSFSSYTSGHIYLYNGSSWDDVTAVFGQFVLKTDIVQSLGQQTDKVPSNKAVDDAINAITRHTRKTDFSLTDLQNAVTDQDLAKYGLHVGDQKTINGHTYVIAGLNVMKGAHSYTCTSNHVGLIVIPHTTTKWNDSSTSGGYAGSNLHSYLVNTVLPMCNTDLGSSHLYHHQKLLSNAVDGSRINRYGQATGASSGWGWVDSYISALTEMQVYGGTVWSSSGYDTGEADQQLPVFQEFKHTDIFGSEYLWLRDVASSSIACFADTSGLAHFSGVSYAFYVAGLILYH